MDPRDEILFDIIDTWVMDVKTLTLDTKYFKQMVCRNGWEVDYIQAFGVPADPALEIHLVNPLFDYEHYAFLFQDHNVYTYHWPWLIGDVAESQGTKQCGCTMDIIMRTGCRCGGN